MSNEPTVKELRGELSYVGPTTRAVIIAAIARIEQLEAERLPDGHVCYLGRVWRIDIAADSTGAPIMENTDNEHGVLCRLVPVEVLNEQ